MFSVYQERHRTKQLLAAQEILFPDLYNSLTHGHEATNGAWPSGPGVKEDEEGKLRRLSLRNTQRFNKEQVTPSWEIVVMLDGKKFDRHKNRTNFLPAVILTFLSSSSLSLSWLSV